MHDHLMRPGRLAQQLTAPLPDISTEHRISILRHPNDMILAVPNRMAATLVGLHARSLHRTCRRPMPPKGVGFPDPLSGTLKEICAEWPCYGYRRVTAELHATGDVVNHKKVMRLMQEQGLTVRPRRRFVATTDSDHDGPIFPNLAKDVLPTGPNELWVADLTYIAI